MIVSVITGNSGMRSICSTKRATIRPEYNLPEWPSRALRRVPLELEDEGRSGKLLKPARSQRAGNRNISTLSIRDLFQADEGSMPPLKDPLMIYKPSTYLGVRLSHVSCSIRRCGQFLDGRGLFCRSGWRQPFHLVAYPPTILPEKARSHYSWGLWVIDG